MRIGEHDTHPAADTLPLMEGQDLAGLVDDIKAHGQREEIVLLDGLILDGRNRYRACIAAKVEPRFRQFDEASEGAPVDFVISANLARRDLDAWDRAATAQRLVALIKKVKKHGLRAKQSRLPGVSDDTAEMAASVTADAVPELVEALDDKVIDLPSAAALSKLEPELQRAAVEKLHQVEPPKPVRARRADESLKYEAGELSPVDVASLRAAVMHLDKSVHGELSHAAQVIRRMAQGLGVRG